MSSILSAAWAQADLEGMGRDLLSRHAGDVIFAAVCAVLVVIVLGGLQAHARSAVVTDGLGERCMRSVREVTRTILACEQDSDPLERVLHADEALARVTQLRSLIGDAEAERLVGVKLHEIHRDAEAAFSKALADFYVAHPALKAGSKYATLASSTARRRREGRKG